MSLIVPSWQEVTQHGPDIEIISERETFSVELEKPLRGADGKRGRIDVWFRLTADDGRAWRCAIELNLSADAGRSRQS